MKRELRCVAFFVGCAARKRTSFSTMFFEMDSKSSTDPPRVSAEHMGKTIDLTISEFTRDGTSRTCSPPISFKFTQGLPLRRPDGFLGASLVYVHAGDASGALRRFFDGYYSAKYKKSLFHAHKKAYEACRRLAAAFNNRLCLVSSPDAFGGKVDRAFLPHLQVGSFYVRCQTSAEQFSIETGNFCFVHVSFAHVAMELIRTMRHQELVNFCTTPGTLPRLRSLESTIRHSSLHMSASPPVSDAGNSKFKLESGDVFIGLKEALVYRHDRTGGGDWQMTFTSTDHLSTVLAVEVDELVELDIIQRPLSLGLSQETNQSISLQVRGAPTSTPANQLAIQQARSSSPPKPTAFPAPTSGPIAPPRPVVKILPSRFADGLAGKQLVTMGAPTSPNSHTQLVVFGCVVLTCVVACIGTVLVML
jgi:hypothetical protein